MKLRLHAQIPSSRANGPGLRHVVWVQGCTLNCPGCFNPATHPQAGGTELDSDDLADSILKHAHEIEGVTVSGGEPLQQFAAVAALLGRLRERSRLSALLFTGFTLEEIERIPRHRELLGVVDVLVAGRYDQTQRVGHHLLGSANQEIHFLSGRYTAADLEPVPETEVTISPGGEIQITGVDPPRSLFAT